MTARTIFRFQFGDANAIREVASSKSSLRVGVILVLLTAIPRNYDQTFILEKPFLWLFGPLLFSTVSASLIFGWIYFVFVRRHLPVEHPTTGEQYRSFLGLFWMTAPVAWFYAIPVERFLGSYQATQVNLGLLAFVALWRVVLLSRVLSVIQQTRFWRALLWVLAPACLEVIGLYIFGGAFAKAFMAGMGGMRNSPEENLLLQALGNSAVAAFWIGLIVLVVAAVIQNEDPLQAFPIRMPGQTPCGFLIVATIVWLALAVYPQLELRRNYEVEQLMEQEKYKEALAYMSARRETDFAPSRQIPPKPYEYEIFEKLPKIFAALSENNASWVRQMYFRYLEIMISHRHFSLKSEEFGSLTNNIGRLPEGQKWLEQGNQFQVIEMPSITNGNQTNQLPSKESISTNQ